MPHLHLAALLSRYGYLTVLAGSFFEGETIVVMGGFAAHRGYLHLGGVMLLAFAGSLAGDQLAYFVGRRYGERILVKRPTWRPNVEKVRDRLAHQSTTWLLVSFRFFYGLRNVVPFAAGLSGVAPRRFVPLNTLGAAIWAPTIATLGYVFGEAVERLLHQARRYEEIALVVIAVVGSVLVVIHRVRRSRE